MPTEGKENVISVQDHDNNAGLSTPINQMKRTESLVRGKRRPLASKDNNRAQSILSVKNNGAILGNSGHPLKRPASNLTKNMPENKLKKYGSVLGMNSFMPRTKSLVLKDTELNETSGAEDEDDEEDDLPVFANGPTANLGFGSGLKALIKQKGDELNIEYAPKRQSELPHVPNGYEPFDKESIEKLKHHRSPFQVDPLPFDTEERDPELINLVSPDDTFDSPIECYNGRHSTKADSDDESITIDFGEEYKGQGLSTVELNSLLD
ncbi:unnamed protein product [Kluyveromyces dobzhanskii CBS 2104]|uniref:WGS project CCBQ000000000 data, contig 00058 n=1 Tax=Kluyveromyces dobzhanskii CBS 2104 TaxID=1427455 RepID=A0A0A8LDG1_9SACH|nr:unnamed protein product [Kluyveromyces dobzhanskii CBS 2104]